MEAVKRAAGKTWANLSVLSLALPVGSRRVSLWCVFIRIFWAQLGVGTHTCVGITHLILVFERMRQEDFQEFEVILATYQVPGQPGLEWDPALHPTTTRNTLRMQNFLCAYCWFTRTQVPLSPDGSGYTLLYSSLPWHMSWGVFHSSTYRPALGPLRAAWHLTIWYSKNLKCPLLIKIYRISTSQFLSNVVANVFPHIALYENSL